MTKKKKCIDVFFGRAGRSRDGVIAQLRSYETDVEAGQHKSIGRAFCDQEANVLQCYKDCVEPITPAMIDQLYEIYMKLPSKTSEGTPYKGGIQPSKRAMISFVEKTSMAEAFVELLDNIFDNYDEEILPRGIDKGLEIEITVREELPGFENGFILIKENSGGISDEKKVPLVRLGHSKHDYPTIGTWGWGAKLAYHKLGKDIEIFSWHLDSDKPFSFWYPPTWLEPIQEPKDPLQWNKVESPWFNWSPNECKVSEESESRLERGTTVTLINNPRHGSELGLIINPDDLQRCLAHTFAEKFSHYQTNGHSIRISINDDRHREVKRGLSIEELIRRECAFFPGLSPVCVDYEWTVRPNNGDEDRTLRASIYVGMTPEGETTVPNLRIEDGERWLSKGIYMWGNNRIFLEHTMGRPERNDSFFYTKRIDDLEPDYTKKIPAWNQSRINRLHIWIKFHSKESRNIPWTAPRKVRFAKIGNPFIEQVERSIIDTAIGFAHFVGDSWSVKPAKFLLPFRYLWNEVDAEQRLMQLFPKGIPDSKYSDETQTDYKKRLKNLAGQKTVKQMISKDINTNILHLSSKQFESFKNKGFLQFRSKKFVDMLLTRMKAMGSPEYDKANLVDFWRPVMGV